MKDIEQHRANTITMIEALLLLERREGDNILVISPKGITPEGWRVANDMAMGLRAITVSKSKKENAESVACATSMVIGLQEDMKILEKLFPKGPRHLHNIMNELSKKFKGIGFGEILKITAKLVYMLETKQY
jgi:D-arabinose 1-dehydrogenase-like Zn-dependent alcohol dehydrogenase